MPYKPGGGNRPELYDPRNGQYTDDIDVELFKKQSLELELTNIVGRVVFKNYHPEDTLFEPRYPIYRFHNDLYCRMYIIDQVRGKNIFIDYQKITKYLLVRKESNDKSHFFELHGYTNKNPYELYEAIVTGTDTNKAKYHKIDEYGLFVEIPTKIYSKREKGYITITTIWRFDENTKRLHFVTVLLKNKNRRGKNNEKDWFI